MFGWRRKQSAKKSAGCPDCTCGCRNRLSPRSGHLYVDTFAGWEEDALVPAAELRRERRPDLLSPSVVIEDLSILGLEVLDPDLA